MYSALNQYILRSSLSLQATLVGRNLGVGGVDATELGSLVVGQGIETLLVDVEARSSVVDGKDVDGLALVGDAVAGAALGGVPAGDALVATEVGGLDVALGLPAVLGDEAVGAVRAGDGGEGAAGVVVAGIVGDGDGRGEGGEAEGKGGSDGGELHGDGLGCWVVWGIKARVVVE